MKEIIQLKITLQGTKPPIWRRILVDKSTKFSLLHSIILTTMGWSGGHLYEFNINGYRLGVPYKEDDGWGGKLLDSSKKSLHSIIGETKGKFQYTYDFGDDWQHIITIEKFLPKDKNLIYPICIDGELNCPPEDCGGVWGYYDFLEKIRDKKHPEHEEMLEWLGEEYDPEYFDKELINKMLNH